MINNWKSENIKIYQKEGAGLLALLSGKNKDSISIYVYLLVPEEGIRKFMHAIKKSFFDPHNFGQIIESGIGLPTKFLHEEVMAKCYG